MLHNNILPRSARCHEQHSMCLFNTFFVPSSQKSPIVQQDQTSERLRKGSIDDQLKTTEIFTEKKPASYDEQQNKVT